MNNVNQRDTHPTEHEYVLKSSISIADILLIITRHIKIVIITPTIFCIVTIVYVLFFAKPIYSSTSKIMSGANASGVSAAAGLAAQFGIAFPTSIGTSVPE